MKQLELPGLEKITSESEAKTIFDKEEPEKCTLYSVTARKWVDPDRWYGICYGKDLDRENGLWFQ